MIDDLLLTNDEHTIRRNISDYVLVQHQLLEKQKLVNVDQRVSPIFTEEEHRILKLLLASKIAEIQVNIVYDEPLDQRMGKVKLINVLNDINEKVKIRR